MARLWEVRNPADQVSVFECTIDMERLPGIDIQRIVHAACESQVFASVVPDRDIYWRATASRGDGNDKEDQCGSQRWALELGQGHPSMSMWPSGPMPGALRITWSGNPGRNSWKGLR